MNTSSQNALRLLIFITLFACILLYLAFQGSPQFQDILFLCLPFFDENEPYEFQDCVDFFYSTDSNQDQQTSDESLPTPTPTSTPNAPSPIDGPSPTPTPTPTPNPDGTPAIINSVCLNPQQLMIVFEFQQPVTGLYEVLVNDVPYLLTPVPDQPNRLFFFGSAPPGGGMPQIVMRTLLDQVVVLEVTDYSVPQCDFQSPNQPGGGDDYVPPPLP
jgi:hypothetical protein